MISYVDSLLKLRVPVDGVTGTTTTVRELSEEDIVSFCSEFLDGSIWAPCAAFEWIMARLVMHQDIQEKLKKEIRSVMGDKKGQVDVEELQRMPYLKAVIFESLRRHNPAHFLIPHRVKEDVMIMADHHEYLIPKGAVVNYLVTSVGLDASVWEEPLEFRPERFMPGVVISLRIFNGCGQALYELQGCRFVLMIGLKICGASVAFDFERLVLDCGAGLAVGMYSGLTYGLKEAHGSHDWVVEFLQ
ncbi:hypothetical protein J5N97_025110 [Dioscorea zingiberensis]|uniref:Cytochrome P450 n=1 Tax=Dioscorea zingiberensis TaxID=325984 RepID=A0A9D5H9Q1_9LILI|nr:hypothetical protein J5N97_025110 [Dioscorea zingiberensis]